MDIYVLINEQPHGPYSPADVRKYLQTGQLQPVDLGAYAGSADWKPLKVMAQSWGAAAPLPPSQKSRKKLLVPIVASLLLAAAGVAGFLWWKQSTATKVAATAAVPAVPPAGPGQPNTLAQLNDSYVEPPQGQNAATFFLQGFAAMKITGADRANRDLPNIGKGPWPAPGKPLPSKTRTAIANFLQRNQAAGEALKKGEMFDQSRYPIDLNKGSQSILTHLSKVKQAAYMVDLAAVLLADKKEPAGAAEALLVSLAEAQSLKQEPVAISQLVRVACLEQAAAALEWVLNSAALSPEDLSRLAGAVAKAEAEESAGTAWTRAWSGERVLMLTTLDLPPDQLEAFLRASGAQTTLEKLTQNLKAQRAFAEETFNHALVMREQSFPDRLKVNEYFTTRTAEAKANDFGLCLLSGGAQAKLILREAYSLAKIRLMQTAIALEQSRAANGGQYPDSLASLSPKIMAGVPADPFDGQPLRYHKTAGGYLLSSIGPDSNSLKFEIMAKAK